MIPLLSAQREARRAAARADRQRRRLHHSSHRLRTAAEKKLTSPGSLALSFSAGIVTGVVFGGRGTPQRARTSGTSGTNIQKVKKTLGIAGRMAIGRGLALFASEVAGTVHRPAAGAAADTGAAVPEA